MQSHTFEYKTHVRAAMQSVSSRFIPHAVPYKMSPALLPGALQPDYSYTPKTTTASGERAAEISWETLRVSSSYQCYQSLSFLPRSWIFKFVIGFLEDLGFFLLY